jgi:hypothetical protein
VRVGDKFGPGKVKVSLSFADWKAGRVAAATFELSVPEATNR